MADAVIFCDKCAAGINIVAGEKPSKCQNCGAIVCHECIKECHHCGKNYCKDCFDGAKHKNEMQKEINKFESLEKFWHKYYKHIPGSSSITTGIYDFEHTKPKIGSTEPIKTKYFAIPHCKICKNPITQNKAKKITVGNNKKYCPYFCKNDFSERKCKESYWKCNVHSMIHKCSEYKKK